MQFLQVSNISKRQTEDKYVVQDISFTQNQGQKIAIAGATGSGKTTLLKMIGGLVQPDEGTLLFRGQKIKGPQDKLIPGHPGIAYLSQYFELRNHYRIEELLGYANEFSDAQAARIYDLCRIGHLLKRKTDQLSGGEKQRIALARLLVTAPRLLLLDEPFSNLDMIHKSLLKTVIADISAEWNINCILISHDPADTLGWADELLLLENGSLVQQGTPWQVYKQPVSTYAAGLLGIYNQFEPDKIPELRGLPALPQGRSTVIIRPEDLQLTEHGPLEGTVTDIRFGGSYYDLEISFSAVKVIARTLRTGIYPGMKTGITVQPEHVWYL